jgi:anti-sigma regulatory factor (Ser/Thr protein kinase)
LPAHGIRYFSSISYPNLLVQATHRFCGGGLFYSDGVTEAFNQDREAFGEERLIHTTVENGQRPAGELIRAVQTATSNFIGSTSLRDDLTCLAVRLTKDRRTSFGACWELKLESRLHELERLRVFLLDLSRQSDRPELVEEALPAVQLAAHEALTNIIQHAYGGQPIGPIHVEAELSSEKMVVTLSHYGRGFDPEEVPVPSFDGSRESGFGLYIVRESMDEVEFLDEPQGRKGVRLVKYLGKTS